MTLQLPKNTLYTLSQVCRLNGKIYISCQWKFENTLNCSCSNIKYRTIFHVLIKKMLGTKRFCKLQTKWWKINHSFMEFNCAIKFWSGLNHYYRSGLCNLRSATFRFFEIDHVLFLHLNKTLSLDKKYTYSSWDHTLLSLEALLENTKNNLCGRKLFLIETKKIYY